MDITAVNPYQYLGQNEQSSFQRLSGRFLRSREQAADPSAASSTDHEKLLQACRDFEALFVKQMLNAMRKTVNKSGLIDGGMAEEIFEDMLYDEYAKKMTKTAGVGLAETLYRELSPQLDPPRSAAARYSDFLG